MRVSFPCMTAPQPMHQSHNTHALRHHFFLTFFCDVSRLSCAAALVTIMYRPSQVLWHTRYAILAAHLVVHAVVVPIEQALRAAQKGRNDGKLTRHSSPARMQALLPVRCQQCKAGPCATSQQLSRNRPAKRLLRVLQKHINRQGFSWTQHSPSKHAQAAGTARQPSWSLQAAML